MQKGVFSRCRPRHVGFGRTMLIEFMALLPSLGAYKSFVMESNWAKGRDKAMSLWRLARRLETCRGSFH